MQTRKEALSDIREDMLEEIVQSFASDRAATVETTASRTGGEPSLRCSRREPRRGA